MIFDRILNNNFTKKHTDFIVFLTLSVVCYFVFFQGIGSYFLMDIDETRYASMAHDMFRSKDFMTLYLNNEFFFEKPPLYFWLECLSFGIFGKVNEFTVRFPVAMLGTLCTFLLYFVGKKVVSRQYGLLSALILATSAEFLILSKFAILDIVLAFCTTFSVFFGFLTLHCEEKQKKYYWWLFCIFSGLAVLAKGIPGFVIPFGTMFYVYIFNPHKFKELFKPIFIIPGTVLFLAIVLPWHIIMLQKHNPMFFQEYIMLHHVARFTTSEALGRKQPLWFFIATIIWGFFPWIVPVLSTIFRWFLKFFFNIINRNFNTDDNQTRFITSNVIAVVIILLFFSISSTKLITYILPIYPFLACLTASIFDKYLNSEEYQKSINISSIIFGIILLITSCLSVLTYKFYLASDTAEIIKPAIKFASPLFALAGILLIVYAKKNCKKAVFSTIVLFMMLLSAFGTPIAFNIDYKFGQNSLIEFAQKAKDENKTLVSFGFGRRFSLNFYYQKHVIYEQFFDYDKLNKFLQDKNTVIVVKTNDLPEIEANAKIEIIEKDKKYSLIKGCENETDN